ncbi:anti-sigma factor family protein [Roseomonas sp. F4]
MTENGAPLPVGEDDLQGWVDGRLSQQRHALVEAWLAENPESAARFRAMAAQRQALRAALGEGQAEPVPARLRVTNLLAARRQARLHGVRRIAAVAAWLMIGGGLGWAGHGLVPQGAAVTATRPMVAEALSAHRVFAADALRPVEVAAAQEAQLVGWLSNRLGRPLEAPDLAPLGYRLLGGRLLAGAAGDPAAQLMYAGPGTERLTVYLRADRAGGAGTEFSFAEAPAQGITAFWWVDRGFGFAVAAQGLERLALQRVAESVHRQVARSQAL